MLYYLDLVEWHQASYFLYSLQISDFGLAKWLPENWPHHVVHPIERTFGLGMQLFAFFSWFVFSIGNLMKSIKSRLMCMKIAFRYLAPEYFMHGIVDEKTDVFAFGVLLLEILTGRRAVDSSRSLWYGYIICTKVIKLAKAFQHFIYSRKIWTYFFVLHTGKTTS